MSSIDRENLFNTFALNDIKTIELLIEFRYKYDGLHLNDGSILDVTGTSSINQEVIDTYIILDDLIKKANLSTQQLRMIKMVGEGYTHREIADEVDSDFQNIGKMLKTIYKLISQENERQWRIIVYKNNLRLKSKICSRCKKELPATVEFYSNNYHAKDFLLSICKKCR